MSDARDVTAILRQERILEYSTVRTGKRIDLSIIAFLISCCTCTTTKIDDVRAVRAVRA